MYKDVPFLLPCWRYFRLSGVAGHAVSLVLPEERFVPMLLHWIKLNQMIRFMVLSLLARLAPKDFPEKHMREWTMILGALVKDARDKDLKLVVAGIMHAGLRPSCEPAALPAVSPPARPFPIHKPAAASLRRGSGKQAPPKVAGLPA